MQNYRINNRHIQQAIKLDDELNLMLQDVVIAEGGVMPHIHPSLVTRTKPKKMMDALEE